jgi:MATE family multidrug resistance protein
LGTPIAEEVREIAKLAGPLILGFVGNNLMGLVDTAMVGRVGATELAGVSIGSGLFFTITVGAMGIVFGMDPVVSQALGAGEGARARAAFRAGVKLGAWISVPCVALLFAVPFLLPAFGIDAGVCTEAKHFLFARAPGAVPFILAMALRSFMQARGNTAPLAYATVVANIINFVGNALFIFGDASLEKIGLPGVGLPAMGVVGAGLASTLATIAQVLVVLRAHLRMPAPEGGGDTDVPMQRLLRIGVPIGITLVAEIGAFTLAGLFAARLGPNPGSGHQIAIMLASLTFNVAVAVANAASVRVGHAIGRGDTPAARRSGFVSLGMVVAYMTMTAAGFLVFARPLAGILSDREDVLAAAIPLVHIAAAFQIFDGVQSVAAGALRGLGETRSVTLANLVGYYVVGLPIALVLSSTLGLGAQGLWWGLSAGLAFVAVSLMWRFAVRSGRHVERVD